MLSFFFFISSFAACQSEDLRFMRAILFCVPSPQKITHCLLMMSWTSSDHIATKITLNITQPNKSPRRITTAKKAHTTSDDQNWYHFNVLTETIHLTCCRWFLRLIHLKQFFWFYFYSIIIFIIPLSNWRWASYLSQWFSHSFVTHRRRKQIYKK